MSLEDSIKAKLKNKAIEEKRLYQEILTTYGLERSLYRLSVSKYAKYFVLKGGILLYALYKGKYTRSTTDIDFLGININNDLDEMNNIFSEIYSINGINDGIQYDLSSMRIIRIIEFKKYPGINISINAYLNRTKIKIMIDIGFGDVVFPKINTINYPTVLKMNEPILQCYSVEMIIAEKFEAIVSLGYSNTRMKDFYDIYELITRDYFDFDELKNTIHDTFRNRKTKIKDVVIYHLDYALDSSKKRLWQSFLKSKNIKNGIDYDEMIKTLQFFFEPFVAKKSNSIKKWDFLNKAWTD